MCSLVCTCWRIHILFRVATTLAKYRLFYRALLQTRPTYFKEPTSRSHPTTLAMLDLKTHVCRPMIELSMFTIQYWISCWQENKSDETNWKFMYMSIWNRYSLANFFIETQSRNTWVNTPHRRSAAACDTDRAIVTHKPHCIILQHTATHCNTLQHKDKAIVTVSRPESHCNTLHHTATHCNTLQHTATHCSTLQHTATHCNTLQHTARAIATVSQHAAGRPATPQR